MTPRLSHDDAMTCHWLIVIGWLVGDMTHNYGYVVYVFRTCPIVMSHEFRACDLFRST